MTRQTGFVEGLRLNFLEPMNKMTIVLVLLIVAIVGIIWYLGSSVETPVVPAAPEAAAPVAESPTSDIDAELDAILLESGDADVENLNADVNQL